MLYIFICTDYSSHGFVYSLSWTCATILEEKDKLKFLNGAGITSCSYMFICIYILNNLVNTNMISDINGLIILPSLNK